MPEAIPTPNRPEAEARLLACLLFYPETWPALAGRFSPAWFADPAHRDVAQAIEAEAKTGKTLSATRVIVRAKKDGAYVDQKRFQEIAESILTHKEALRLADTLEDLWRRREMLSALREQAAAVMDTDTDLDETHAALQAAILRVMQATQAEEVRDWSDVLTDVHRELVEVRSGETEQAWPLGLTQLTGLIGGLSRKRLYVFMARPNMGKSALLQWVVRWLGANRGVRSLVFTPDQLATEWAARALWDVSNVPGSSEEGDVDWQHPRNWPEGVWQQVQAAFSEIRDFPIRILDRRGYTVDRLCAIARAEKAAHPDLGLIVLDHLTRLRFATEDRRRNWSGVIGDAVSRLRDLADELDVAFVLAAQLNRDVEHRDDKRPRLSDLRDSGEIEEHADVVIGLYRHEYYYAPVTGEEPYAGVVELHALKQKQGGRNQAAFVRFEGEFCRFGDLTAPRIGEYSNFLGFSRKWKPGKKRQEAAS